MKERTQIKSLQKIDSLNDIDDVEEISEILSKSEIEKINKVFNSIDDFYQFLETFDYALENKDINTGDIKIILDSIYKFLNHRSRNRVQKRTMKKRGFLLRLIFELPELISGVNSYKKSKTMI
jgi:hypothetical protein